MGRKKGYEPSSLVQAALGLFHAHGYHGTSTHMLVEALGVNRNSMYSEFGSKQGLFDAVLSHYETNVLAHVLGPLERDDATLETVSAFFVQFGRLAAGPASGLGCLLCNTAVELAGVDPGAAAVVPRYFTRIEDAFRTVLGHARRDGVLARSVKVADEARLMTAMTLGVFVLVRGRAPAATVQGAARAVVEHVTRLQAPPVHGGSRERRSRRRSVESR